MQRTMYVTPATLRKTHDISTAAAGAIRSIHASSHRMHCLADDERAIITCFVARHMDSAAPKAAAKRARGESSEREDAPVDEPEISSAKAARRSALDLQRRSRGRPRKKRVSLNIKALRALLLNSASETVQQHPWLAAAVPCDDA
eukprot:ANDGO_07725.mRNA.1 hypothetical protein